MASDLALTPSYDPAPGLSDFKLADRLCQLIFDLSAPNREPQIELLLCAAFNSPRASFNVSNKSCPAPAEWTALFSAAELANGCPVFASPHEAQPNCPEAVAVQLVWANVRLGQIGIAGRLGGYPPELVERLSELTALLSKLLYARLNQTQQQESVTAYQQELRLKTETLDRIHDSVIAMDLDGYITDWNRGAERLFGYSAAEIVGKNILSLYADTEKDDPLFNLFLENGSREMTVRRRKKSGELFWASISFSVLQDEQGHPSGFVGYVVDVSERIAAEEKLRLHARIFEINSEAIIVMDASGQIISANQAFSSIMGYEEFEVLGRNLDMLVAHEDRHLMISEARHRNKIDSQWSGQLQFKRKSGLNFPAWVSISSMEDAQGGLGYCFLFFSDISERHEVERQNVRLAYYDPLTGLPNRALFYARLEQFLAQMHNNRHHSAVLLLDLNRFKNINDSFGYNSADAILQDVGQRLLTSLRKEDLVARLGGDEFAIALFDIKHRDHAGQVAQKLLSVLSEPFYIEQNEILLSASIGISLLPDDGNDTETLLKNADIAMFLAKKLGNSTHVFYAHDMNPHSLEQLKLEGNLRRAIERSEFYLHYQPQLELASGRITGAEALLRWNQPEQGLIPPTRFIAIAEETGLIVPVGEWVLDAVCRQIRQWKDQGLDTVRIAVNLSARQFSASLPSTILGIIARHGIPNDSLELEITESMLMHNTDSVVAMMHEFGQAGILISLDDFGTGYSSLSYLKRFPIDNLKIDQSFVRGLPGDSDDSAIARAIISMAKSLRLSVVAEGVETSEQLAFLRDAGCDEIQGYYFSRPVPAEEFAALLTITSS
ncbi:MAG: EAL domain-containing protein [Pseudomonadota bacterium]